MSAGLSIIIPAYNEAASLKQRLAGWTEYCRSRGYDLILVDDGSQDDTAAVCGEFARRGSLQLIRHRVNRGYGAALKSGIRAARTDYIATMDADGQHSPAGVEQLFAAAQAQGADLAIGWRTYTRGESAYRRFGKWCIRRVAGLVLKAGLHDLNSGLKVFRAVPARKFIRVCPDSMAFSDIFSLVFVNQQALVIEVPVQADKRVSGRSTIGTSTALETVWALLLIAVCFNPMRVFLPLSLFLICFGVLWEIPILLAQRGISVGASLLVLAGLIFLFLGLISEQLAIIQRASLEEG